MLARSGTTRLVPRILAIAIAGVTAACGTARPAGPPRFLTVMPTAPHHVFPATRGLPADSVACAPPGPRDTTVAFQSITSPSRYLGALGLRLPSAFVASPARLEDRRYSEMGGLLVGGWYAVGDARGDDHRGTSVSVWIVPESGLPAVGADPKTRQTSYTECAAAGPVPNARVAVFTLVSGAQSTAYLTAGWRLQNGRTVQLIAHAPRVESLAPVRRALLDARTEPPKRLSR